MKPTKSDHMSDEALAAIGLSRETNLRMDRHGDFFAGDQRVEHPGVAAGFSRWIERNDAGRYVLRNDLHYVYVQVEGAPLHALNARAEGEGITLCLKGGVDEPLRPETLRQDSEGVVYASGRDGTWPIRLAPRALVALEPWLTEHGEEVVLLLGGRSYPIPEVEDALSAR